MTSFVGREQEYSKLEDLIEESVPKKNVIFLSGAAGIGKTRLAEHLYVSPRLQPSFDCRARVSAYRRDWVQIVRRIAHRFLSDLPVKATADELMQRIIKEATERRYLLFLDNLDAEDVANPLIRFIDNWSATRISVLLLTGRRFPLSREPAHCQLEPLFGLKGDEATKYLLGHDMAKRIKYCGLRDRLDKVLGGNPQNLLYLRWSAPERCAAIRELIQHFGASGDPTSAIDAVLERIELPVEHFLSLANIRNPVFDEALLALLWDRLGGGGTEYYIQVLNRLRREGLLAVAEPGELRLNASVHAQLQKPFYALVPPERRAHIDYFIGEYFRNRFAVAFESFLDSRSRRRPNPTPAEKTVFPIEDLDSYVYHTVTSGHADSACSYIFGRDILELAHAEGLSLDLKQILETIINGLQEKLRLVKAPLPARVQLRLERIRLDAADTLADNEAAALPADLRYFLERLEDTIPDRSSESESISAPEIRLRAMAAHVRTELGRTHKDLNDHPAALRHLKEAVGELDSLPEDRLTAPQSHRLRADIAHYRGIVYSVTGCTKECLESYFGGIRYAAEHQCFNARGALSMGYLAYELKFHDIKDAQRWAAEAVERARNLKDEVVLAKNLCTLGQIQSFIGETADSAHTFEDARRILGDRDIRERCRILVDWSVNYISQKEFGGALANVDEVKRHFSETGDRRRIWMASAYRGIVQFHQGYRAQGMAGVMEALENHKRLGTQREMIYEAMTYIWMLRNGSVPMWNGIMEQEFVAINQMDDVPDIVKTILDLNMDPSLHVFVTFWRTCYLPTLLTGHGPGVAVRP